MKAFYRGEKFRERSLEDEGVHFTEETFRYVLRKVLDRLGREEGLREKNATGKGTCDQIFVRCVGARGSR